MSVYNIVSGKNIFKLGAIFILFIFAGSLFSGEEARPLIGITSVYTATESDTIGRVYTNMSYVNAVLEAGGTPVVLPPIRSEEAIAHYVESLHGLLLVGGFDIPPSFYGEKAHPTVDSLTARRFWFESRLISAWLKTCDKPILGICLGCQFINVVCGGTLIQDIPAEIGGTISHRQDGGASHKVQLKSNSRLFSILGEENIVVNSFHHQAVDRVGEPFVIVARAADDVVEALEMPGSRFALCVQWHPERLDYEHRNKIFAAFINACIK